jgi:16S rRNA G966 N2-methylase RsmD
VDADAAAVAAVRANLVATGLAGPRATVVRADALRWAAAGTADVDLAFCDPPYAFDRWTELLDALPAALAVLESDREVDPGPGWEVVRSRRYGGTVVTVVERVRGAG